MPTHCTGKEWKELFYYLPSSFSSRQPTECHDYWNTFDGQCLPPLQGRHCWPGEALSTSTMNWTTSKGHRRTPNNQVKKRSPKWVPFYRVTLSRLSFSCLKYTTLQSRGTASTEAKHKGSFSFRSIPGFQLCSLQESKVIPQSKVKHKIYPTTSNKAVLQDIKIPLIAAALFMLCHHKFSTGL